MAAAAHGCRDARETHRPGAAKDGATVAGPLAWEACSPSRENPSHFNFHGATAATGLKDSRGLPEEVSQTPEPPPPTENFLKALRRCGNEVFTMFLFDGGGG